MSNSVPSGWCSGALTEFTDLKHGFQFRTPDFSDKGVKVVKIGQVIGNGKIDLSTCDYVLPEIYEMRKSFSLKTGDILMSLTGNIGRVGIVPELAEPLLQNYRVGLFESNSDACFKWYLFHLLSSEFVTNQLLDKSNTTAQANFGKSDLDQVVVTLPPLPEQQKIAAILTSVDEVIESTQAQINKLKDLKTGMMQELLTKGIGRDGLPRTEFKDSPVGRIPKDWEVVKTGEVTKSIVPGRNKPKSLDGEIPWITISDLDGLEISKSKNGFGVSRIVLSDAGGKTIPKNSVIMTVVGEFGISSVATTELVINQQLHAFVCGERIVPMFLCLLLRFKKIELEKLATQTTIAYMNKENTESLYIPLPTVSEQIAISNTLISIDQSVVTLTNKMTNLLALKKALMQDLLTGKVRVKVN